MVQITYVKHNIDFANLFDKTRAVATARFFSESLFERAYRILMLAFDSNGYVSGGFARFLYRYTHNLSTLPGSRFKEERFLDSFSEYLTLSNRCYWVDDLNRLNTANKSDIDIWFPDEESLNDFMAKINLQDVISTQQLKSPDNYNGLSIQESLVGYATELILDGRLLVQVIKTCYLEPEDLFDCFDIVNSMIAFNKTHFIYDASFPSLESSQTLMVRRWSSLHTLHRILKYLGKDVLNKIDDTTSEGLVAYATTALDDIKNDPTLELEVSHLTTQQNLRLSKQTTFDIAENIKKYLYNMKSFMNNKDVLLLLALGFDKQLGYQSLMEHLKKKSGLPLSV